MLVARSPEVTIAFQAASVSLGRWNWPPGWHCHPTTIQFLLRHCPRDGKNAVLESVSYKGSRAEDNGTRELSLILTDCFFVEKNLPLLQPPSFFWLLIRKQHLVELEHASELRIWSWSTSLENQCFTKASSYTSEQHQLDWDSVISETVLDYRKQLILFQYRMITGEIYS